MPRVSQRFSLGLLFLFLIVLALSLFSDVFKMPTGEARSAAGFFAPLQNPPPTSLTDDFNDNSLDANKWTADNLFSGSIDLNLPFAETAQRFEIGPLLQNTSGSHYRGIRSLNSYEFTGAYTYVELVQPASSATSADTMFTIGPNVEAYYRIYVSAGTLHGQRKNGGVKNTLFVVKK